jgi:hypothetical protein
MTRRRIIEPGTTWALSRRTTRRYFLLNPANLGRIFFCCEETRAEDRDRIAGQHRRDLVE